MSHKLIVIIGPTAVGKTRFAVRLANEFNGEIISADSRQVYKLMDIGTGKDLNEYFFDGKCIPYHLIDFVSPRDEYNLFRFVKDFNEEFNKICMADKVPFLVGGTAMYINAILKNYELPETDFSDVGEKFVDKSDDELRELLLSKKNNLHNTTDLLDRKRLIKAILLTDQKNMQIPVIPKIEYLVIGITDERDNLKKKIDQRLKFRLQNGMIEEARKLIESGVDIEKLKFFGLEYKYLAEFLEGKLNYNDMYQKLRSAITGFAKRQMTWFRKMEREGIRIEWLRNDEYEKARNLINNFLSR